MDLSGYSISEVRKMIKSKDRLTPGFLYALAQDRRVGIRKLYLQLIKLEKELERENKRLDRLFNYENVLYDRGITYIAGVDEAGRGPLAGPVVAAAVILPVRLKIAGLDDSKKLSSNKRAKLAELIKRKAIAWGLGVGTVSEIEKFNIHHASLLAMKRALKRLCPEPQYILVDGFDIPNIDMPQKSIKGGDALSASIASASIIAKVTRDSIMNAYDRRFPYYGFQKNKGYPTSDHIKALKRLGPSPVHRINFKPVRDLL